MPTETGTAFLVDPAGLAPQTLSEREFEQVRNYLDIMRNEKAGNLADAIHWLLYIAIDSSKPSPDMDMRRIVGLIVHHFISNLDGGESGGVISDTCGLQIEVISDREEEILRWTLATLRGGGWFPEWLAIQVGIRADVSQDPNNRFASPLRVAASLVEVAKEFETSIEAAREMVRMRPDLIQADMPIYPIREAVPEPPAPETALPATLRSATRRRARKPRKEASHA